MNALLRREFASFRRSRTRCWRCSSSSSATDTPAPPLLLKLRSDLKNAMRAKDTARLNVLRGVLADVTNASKTSNPVQTDLQLASLLRKKSSASSAAAEEFTRAKRDDMTAKELEQVEILNDYASSVEMLSEEEMKTAAGSLIADMYAANKAVHVGSVLKGLVGPAGRLEGKPVDKGLLSRIVKETLERSGTN